MLLVSVMSAVSIAMVLTVVFVVAIALVLSVERSRCSCIGEIELSLVASFFISVFVSVLKCMNEDELSVSMLSVCTATLVLVLLRVLVTWLLLLVVTVTVLLTLATTRLTDLLLNLCLHFFLRRFLSWLVDVVGGTIGVDVAVGIAGLFVGFVLIAESGARVEVSLRGGVFSSLAASTLDGAAILTPGYIAAATCFGP